MGSEYCSCYGRCPHCEDFKPVSITCQPSDGGFHPPDKPQIDHLVRDLWAAVEDGNFAVETPRVHTEQDGFEAVTVSKTHAPPTFGQLRCERGPPMVEVELDWAATDSDLYEDLDGHARDIGRECILYGRQHLWQVERPWDFDLTAEIAHHDDRLMFSARLGWRTFEEIGWR